MEVKTKEFLYKNLIRKFPKEWVSKIVHYRMHKRFGTHAYIMNLNNPQTFNEKINWLNLNERNSFGKIVADKYLVRKHVKEKLGEEYLIPLIAVYDDVSEIDYEGLPEKFVLKPNHGSGWVVLCDDKKQFNKKKANFLLEKWHNLDFYQLSGEWQYQGIQRKVVCEELIDEIRDIVDYKFFCFNGEPKLVQVDLDRHENHVRSFYDMKWSKTGISLMYPSTSKTINKPSCFEEMIGVAKKLSEEFKFCRVDLYDAGGKVYFGEITLHPGGGNEPFGNYDQDLNLGREIKLKRDQS